MTDGVWKRVVKNGDLVDPDCGIELLDTSEARFVSRGGLKLEGALSQAGLDPAGWLCLDIGQSTGGFTDCLLQHGATRVFAVDVGTNQLAWKLRNDPRVVVMEQTNARHLTAASFGPDFAACDLIVADCSFISLRKILPPAAPLLRPGGRLVVLVKPQFEAGKEEADRGEGVITDPVVHARVLAELEEFVAGQPLGLVWRGVTESPLLGPAGNKEFLALLEKTA
jgi:23S rRNA (cytidine1920-2'-O)/16S rRNA (cytidine1409-2'-O)-methyltransferase